MACNSTGTVSNTATVAVPAAWSDPELNNNSANDTDDIVTAAAAALAVDTAGNGVFEPGETASVSPSWTNTGAAAFAITGALSNHTGPAGGTYGIPDDWEEAHGLNPGEASDAGRITPSGYTNLEHFLNRVVPAWSH